ncbi:Protein kinase [Mollivirus sibericum]|uniref:serine-threonine kinase n=1 Tax=Mollivirus sibericum TaxID=1678078 RepID=UPI0006B2E07A|nr:serine-threonine kinase [Mollivirus sibericum]ALD62154.1 Protein kinase [Mollivirus sibericum]
MFAQINASTCRQHPRLCVSAQLVQTHKGESGSGPLADVAAVPLSSLLPMCNRASPVAMASLPLLLLLLIILILGMASTALSASPGVSGALVIATVDQSNFGLMTSLANLYSYNSDEVSLALATRQPSAIIGRMDSSLASDIDDIIATSGPILSTMASGWRQLPVAAYGLAVAANIWPMTNQPSEEILIFLDLVVGIYTGQVNSWDHPDIAGFNPDLAALSGMPILLPVPRYETSAEEACSIFGTFARSLASLDPDGFGATYRASGNILWLALNATVPSRLRLYDPADYASPLDAVKAWPGSIGFDLPSAVTAASQAPQTGSTISIISFLTSTGTYLVGVSDSIVSQAAATAYLEASDSLDASLPGGLAAWISPPLLNASYATWSQAGWPFIGLSYVSVPDRVDSLRCQYAGRAIAFIAWLLVNDAASAVVRGDHVSLSSTSFRQRSLESLGVARCLDNATSVQLALESQFYTMGGPASAAWTAYASAYSSKTSSGLAPASLRIKSLPSLGVSTTAAATLASTSAVDFAQAVDTMTGINSSSASPLLTVVPVGMRSIVCAHTVPNPAGSRLVLSLDALSAILAGDVTSWSDPFLADLNPWLGQLLATLDETPVLRFVLDKGGNPDLSGGRLGGSVNKMLLTMMESRETRVDNDWMDKVRQASTLSPEDNRTITYLVWPLEGLNVSSVSSVFGQDDVAGVIAAQPWSLGCAVGDAVLAQRTLGLCAMVNAEGNTVEPGNRASYAALLEQGYADLALRRRQHPLPPLRDLVPLPGSCPTCWPMGLWQVAYINADNPTDCARPSALSSWFDWFAGDASAATASASVLSAAAVDSASARSAVVGILAALECQGTSVYAKIDCVSVDESTGLYGICHDRGTCLDDPSIAGCKCDEGYEGDLCQTASATSTGVPSSDGVNITVILAAVIPVAAALAVVLCVMLIVLAISLAALKRTRRTRLFADDPLSESALQKIDITELDMGEMLDSGAGGDIYRATWNGTDVVVKFVLSRRETIGYGAEREMVNYVAGGSDGDGRRPRGITSLARFVPGSRSRRARALAMANDAEENQDFIREVILGGKVRHPKVIAFRAVCVSHRAIVMEYMPLGSIRSVIENELIPNMPFFLKMRIVRDVGRALQFIHGQGIVHGDVKSLNVLLDSKWYAKLSDFGTAARIDRCNSQKVEVPPPPLEPEKVESPGENNADRDDAASKKRPHQQQQQHQQQAAAIDRFDFSIHWAAPEVIETGRPTTESDIYSLAIVMWELITWRKPYAGMEPSAIMFGVMRDSMRPGYGNAALDIISGGTPNDIADHAVHMETSELVSTQDGSEALHRAAVDYCRLMENCWKTNVTTRPVAGEVVNEIKAIHARMTGNNEEGYSSSMTGGGTSNTGSSYSDGSIATQDTQRAHRHGLSARSNTTVNSLNDNAVSILNEDPTASGLSSMPRRRRAKGPRGSHDMKRYLEDARERPVADNAVLVLVDLPLADSLWNDVPMEMVTAIGILNNVMRTSLRDYRGYESALGRKVRKGLLRGTGTGYYAFPCVADAVAWCQFVQVALCDARWPQPILSHKSSRTEPSTSSSSDRDLFRGLRVRMAIHDSEGRYRMDTDKHSGKVEYVGRAVDEVSHLAMRAEGGQVLLSASAVARWAVEMHAAAQAADDTRPCLVVLPPPKRSSGKEINAATLSHAIDQERDADRETAFDHQGAGSEPHVRLFQLVVGQGLEGRHFGDYCIVTLECLKCVGRLEAIREEQGPEQQQQQQQVSAIVSDPAWGNALQWPAVDGEDEDEELDVPRRDQRLNYLSSVRLCSYFIQYSDLVIDPRVIGSGSYGEVHKGKWKGTKVAVKRLIYINRRSEEAIQRLLSETAVLSTVQHRHIVSFVGACIQEPHLCLVTEYVAGGSLRKHLDNRNSGGSSSNSKINVSFDIHSRLFMLLGAAKGLRHLHRKGIHHRDVKAANILIEPREDSAPDVKVCDFGMAHTKNQARTATRGGTPAWTAPEIIRGAVGTDKSDVYSFGILMWEVLTKQYPFANQRIMAISLKVLEGERPSVPLDTPNDYGALMVRCWAQDPTSRPSMHDVVNQLRRMIAIRKKDEHGKKLPLHRGMDLAGGRGGGADGLDEGDTSDSMNDTGSDYSEDEARETDEHSSRRQRQYDARISRDDTPITPRNRGKDKTRCKDFDALPV